MIIIEPMHLASLGEGGVSRTVRQVSIRQDLRTDLDRLGSTWKGKDGWRSGKSTQHTQEAWDGLGWLGEPLIIIKKADLPDLAP